MTPQPVQPHAIAINPASLTGTENRKSARPARSLRLSVIICTYNRRTMVLSTLCSLRNQTLPNSSFEVIVVDNGSADGTFDAVQDFIERNTGQAANSFESWQARCLEEPENGLAYARNKGVLAAAGEVLVFLDDDTLADADLLERLLEAYEQTGAEVIGGCVELRWEAVRPYWLSDDLLELLGYFMPFRTRCELPESLCLSSACFSLTREALQRVGGFVPFLSKRLHTPVNGEIAHLCRRLREAGYALWYEPAAMVRHRVTWPRLARAFIVGRAYWQGRSEILTEYWHDRQQAIDAGKDIPIGRQLWRVMHNVLPDLGATVRLTLIRRPQLFLTNATSYERLQATLALNHYWGRIQQQLVLLKHAPALESRHMVLPGDLPTRERAREHLGLTLEGFVYLCLAYQHTERELLRLVTAFAEASRAHAEKRGSDIAAPQLLIAGAPQDRPGANKLLRSAALVSGVHLCLAEQVNALPWHMGAADALVQPYFARAKAKVTHMARLFHSYNRVVIAPDLTHGYETLPVHGYLLYDPASTESLTVALQSAQEYT